MIDATVPLAGRWSVQSHLRVRSQTGGGALYQGRAGAILQYAVTGQTTLMSGYYYTPSENDEHDWSVVHRVFAGGEHAWLRAKNWKVDARHILERYYSNQPTYFRQRNRLRVESTRRIGPYTAIELFFDADGVRSTRYFAGVKAKTASTWTADIGYFYEDRRPRQGGDRHMIYTTFSYQKQSERD